MKTIAKFRINQGILFHVYNWIIPLIIPSIIILTLAYYYSSTLITTIRLLLAQFFLYNTVVLSTNIGLLNQPKNIKDNFKDKNTAFSICLVLLNVILFSIIITSDLRTEILQKKLLIIFSILAILLVYLTIFLLSKNKEAAFAKEPDISKLADERDKGEEKLIHKILGHEK